MASSQPQIGKAAARKQKRTRLLYEHRVSLYSFLVALPALVVSGFLVRALPWTLSSRIALVGGELLAWWLLATALQEQTTRPLQTLANVIAALREEDYSFRARNALPQDAMGELSLEVNALADMLSEQKTRSVEATALLRRVVDEIDAPLFAFDPQRVLRLVNPAGERFLQQPAARGLGLTAGELGLEDCLTAANESLIALNFGSSRARWLLRRSSFRQKGVPHTLVLLSDVSRALREEERRTWQRLIRVLGHELSNSLTPIKSIASSLSARITDAPMDAESRRDIHRGLEIIEARSASLHRFLQAYRRLAQMPPPLRRGVALAPLVARVAGLETRIRVRVVPGPETIFCVDPDQLEQMLINLVRNAADAVLERSGGEAGGEPAGEPPQPGAEVAIAWRLTEEEAVFTIEDNGPGLLNPANVFTPFYTTKPNGSGVGLLLSRQIAEAHGGRIDLCNRTDARGCRVTVTLPTASAPSALAE